MWDELKEELNKEYFKKIMKFIDSELASGKKIAPQRKDLFKIFETVKYEDVKVVILGQDPYPTPGHANGLAFATNDSKTPKSLQNIFKEVQSDIGTLPKNNDLTNWLSQGVFLLNTSLSTIEGETFAHKQIWQPFTDEVIKLLNQRQDPVVFILWGNPAQDKKKFITSKQHLVIETVHPSPLSAYRGFFGSKVFSKANEFLIKNHKDPIDWGNS